MNQRRIDGFIEDWGVEAGGCLFCGSLSWTMGDCRINNLDFSREFQVTCSKCGSMWTQVYRMDSVTDVTIGKRVYTLQVGDGEISYNLSSLCEQLSGVERLIDGPLPEGVNADQLAGLANFLGAIIYRSGRNEGGATDGRMSEL